MENINQNPENSEEEKEDEYSINIESAKQHLDNVPDQYFEMINENTEAEFQSFIKKLEPIRRFLQNPTLVMSVGVGGGLELRSLAELFKGDENTKIIGLDLSKKALDTAKKYLDKYGVHALLVQSGAVNMPFKQNNTHVNGIVLSAIMHEIYSYVEDGKSAWKKAVQEASITLSENGILLLRDFAAPETNDIIEVSFLNQDVEDFYEYFRTRFRTFKTWSATEVDKMKDKRTTLDDYPQLGKSKKGVTLPFSLAAELMLHYRNYVAGLKNGVITGFSDSWKEVDEQYLIPDPDSSIIMNPKHYKDKVLQCANDRLAKDYYRLECVMLEVVGRPETANEMRKYFSLKHEKLSQEELFKQATSKMESAFKKVKLNN